MFQFLFRKQHQLQSLIYDYLDTLKLIQDNFSRGVTVCLENPCSEDLAFLAKQTHKFESKADDIREEIKTMMYGKVLIPESRGDIMGLMEAMDLIPGLFERILYMIQTQELVIPKFIAAEFRDLVRISLECCDQLRRQVTALFKKTEDIRALSNTIDLNESHCDHLERRLITKIFRSGMDPFIKLQLKELILQVGEISDQADRVARRVNIIYMKRRV
jgi:predicted phosphate transport protein (TIGR00153 family)